MTCSQSASNEVVFLVTGLLVPHIPQNYMPLAVCERKEVLKGIYGYLFSVIDLHSMLDSLLSWLEREILCDF